jgi:hypothetical protein
MDRDYEALLHQTGATPPHPLALPHPAHVAHPAALGAPPPQHHPVVHDARAFAHEVMNHLHPHLQAAHALPPPHGAPAHQGHAPHYPPPSYAYGPEHEPHLGHMRHRHDDEGPAHAHGHEPHVRRRTLRHATRCDDPRMFPIGFVQAAVPPGATTEIEVKPQVRFQGKRLAVAPSVARFFNIIDIKVGKDSQLAATGELTAEALSALAVDVRVELDPAPPGIVITIFARNKDTAAQDFEAVLYGLVEEDED